MRTLALLALLVSTVACEKANKSNPDEASGKAVQNDVTRDIKPLPPLDLNSAKPVPDGFVVLFHFDTLRRQKLSAAAESIMVTLPDYVRIFGATPVANRGDLAADLFDSVIISNPNPRYITTATFAARGSFDPEALRQRLSFPGAGVQWETHAGKIVGSFVQTPEFDYLDQRQYLSAEPGWFVLADRKHLQDVFDPAIAALPAWFRKSKQLVERARREPAYRDLLVSASVIVPPTSGAALTVPIPGRVDAWAFADGEGVRFQGTLHFETARKAEQFVSVAMTARLAIGQFKDRLPPGSLAAITDAKLEQDGTNVHWKTKASRQDVLLLCQYTARQAAAHMASLQR